MDKQGGIHNTTVFSYDKAGNIICITDNQGRETRLEYDPMNREIRRIEKDGAVTRQIYDRNGQLSKVIRPNEYQAHGDAGFVYTYDEEGRILTVIRTADAAGSGAGFTYDFGGRRTRVRTTGQASQEYEYDALGNTDFYVFCTYNILTKHILDNIARGEQLPENYEINNEELILYLTRTGTHSDLF